MRPQACPIHEALGLDPKPAGTWPDVATNRIGLVAETATLLEVVRRALERDPLQAREAALSLVRLLTPATPDNTDVRGGLAPWQQRKIARYLRDHLARAVRLEELAEQVPLSVSHFCRAFKASFGTTPHTYINGMRIKLAQQLMQTTQEPLSQIALACGLADQAHLSKLFRRCVGETPSAWRRRNATDAQAVARGRPSIRPGQSVRRPDSIASTLAE
jgi:AraC family transcriptional regulator